MPSASAALRAQPSENLLDVNGVGGVDLDALADSNRLEDFDGFSNSPKGGLIRRQMRSSSWATHVPLHCYVCWDPAEHFDDARRVLPQEPDDAFGVPTRRDPYVHDHRVRRSRQMVPECLLCGAA